MASRIEPYQPEHIPAVQAFNARLKEKGVTYRFPEGSKSKWLPRTSDARPYQEYFLSIEDDAVVRGGYVLKHQDFRVAGNVEHLAYYHLPLSEGIIDPIYGMTGVQLLTNALKRHPVLFCLGIGGRQEALAQMIAKMGWTLETVPFYFYICSPYHFLRNVRHLRKQRARRLALDAAAFSGLGWLGARTVQAFKTRRPSDAKDLRCVEEDTFGDWADEVWERCAAAYPLVAVRDARTLNLLFPAAKAKYHRLKIMSGDSCLGWVLVTNNAWKNHRYFGPCQLGAIVDGLVLPEHAASAIFAAARFLTENGAQVIVSTQSHAAWCDGLDRAGFSSGPSNFLFARSKKLKKLTAEIPLSSCHLNRGDGDGPIGL